MASTAKPSCGSYWGRLSSGNHRGCRGIVAVVASWPHAARVQVHVWTIDDPIEMNALLDRGVDGIMTDRTDILRDVLRARGQWHGLEAGRAFVHQPFGDAAAAGGRLKGRIFRFSEPRHGF